MGIFRSVYKISGHAEMDGMGWNIVLSKCTVSDTNGHLKISPDITYYCLQSKPSIIEEQIAERTENLIITHLTRELNIS